MRWTPLVALPLAIALGCGASDATDVPAPGPSVDVPEPPGCEASGTCVDARVFPPPAEGFLELVPVPAGPFVRGCQGATDAQCAGATDTLCYVPAECPAHEVVLDAFEIGRTEVTVGAYRACVQAGACTPPADYPVCNYGWDGRESYPINCVNWFQADVFCRWAGLRLPTEAEWEKAARGADARIYPWGNDEPTCAIANTNDCSGKTVAVGSYPDGASPYGALDMAGNVWEWVADLWEERYYSEGPRVANPKGPATGEYRVSRGGGFGEEPKNVRASRRGEDPPDDDDGIFGFRCARSSPDPL